jgi:superkiller protein 3
VFVENWEVSLGDGWSVIFIMFFYHDLSFTGDENYEEAYRFYIESLKCNPAYAPSFTSLGIYYAEFASPPDPKRASKCFQKAFELDAREADAARRLVEGFAEEREWDLVEVVARRTIDGEGGLNAGLKEGGGVAPGRYLPTNAWAWKALGIVELVSPIPLSPG